jgi:hypothetical protein
MTFDVAEVIVVTRTCQKTIGKITFLSSSEPPGCNRPHYALTTTP